MERSTRQRSAIRTVIDAAGRPPSPQEILETAQATVPALGMATVYRNLKMLVDEGAISVMTLPGDNPRYESAERARLSGRLGPALALPAGPSRCSSASANTAGCW